MPPTPSGHSPLRCDLLEARETPTASIISDSFDTTTTPWLPPTAWQSWASNGQDYYGVSGSAALSPARSMAVYGNTTVTSYAWSTTPVPADAVVSAAVRAGVPAPIQVLARGRNLATTSASYVAAVVAPGSVIELRESANGVVTTFGRVVPSTVPAAAAWLQVTLTTRGDRAEVTVRRTDTGQYLTANGQWQAAAATTLTAAVLLGGDANTLAGVGRLPGPYGTAYVDDFTVAPVETGSVTIPRNYPHIRIAQIAYSGTPVGTFEQNLFRESIDLVVANPNFMQTFEQASAETPQLVYSNVSNLYLDLLADWISFATRTGADREAAFYHVARATPFTGGSPSSQPVTWFWGVYRSTFAPGATLTDLTPHARGGRSTGVKFGPVGESVAIGQLDRFREINYDPRTGASPGWTAKWEYVSAVNASGAPTAWKPLTLLTDTTAGLRWRGEMTFDPPSDWRAAQLPGTTSRLFYVRARTTAGTTALAPEARTLFGRDFVDADGQPRGTIPAFDFAADGDGDGYLNDAEYSGRRDGFDARFIHETRLFYPFYGQMRFGVNPASAAVRAWAADYHVRLLADTPLADAVFLDNQNGKPPLGGAVVMETAAAANHPANSAALVRAVGLAIAPKWVMSNTAGARVEGDLVAGASTAAFEEFLLRPLEANWSQVGDAADIVGRRLRSADPSPYVVLDSHPAGGSVTDPRTQLATLAYYYLLGDPDKTFLMFYGGFAPSSPWNTRWVPAAAVNVGRPTAAMSTFALGTDPQNPALNYKVYGRTYQNGLVLYKPRSYTLGKGIGTTQAATATTHQLGGSYRAVNADGSLGPLVTSVTLRNGEGVVLLKA